MRSRAVVQRINELHELNAKRPEAAVADSAESASRLLPCCGLLVVERHADLIPDLGYELPDFDELLWASRNPNPHRNSYADRLNRMGPSLIITKPDRY